MNRVGSPTRRVAAGVAIVLVLSVLLSVADPAHAQTLDTQAQTRTTFVSSAGKTVGGSGNAFLAQSFETGANAGGYNSTRTLSTGLEPGTEYDVRIRSLNGEKPSDNSTKVTARGRPENEPVTGLPTFSGDTAPGSELMASVLGIGDADGLLEAQFTYQWLRVSAGSEAPISGANSATYVVSLDDLGLMLKVQVSFTDDLGNPETFTSMASVSVTFPAGECDAIDLGDRRSVWSGVMNPIALATTPPATGYNANIGGMLSDTQLAFDNETRTIERFEVLNVSADLILAFDQALTDRGNETLRLHLCGKALDISDATTNIDGVISWPGAGPDWSSETNVQAELSIPGSHPPRFAADSVDRDLAENSPSGAAVGDPVTAVDWDDDTLSYTLSGTYAAAFEIDPGTGQITTAPNAKFDFENTSALEVTVTATDPGGDSDTVEVSITVTDEPEPPTGLPTIVGIAQENRALYADLYYIEDPDGIDRNSFSYEWVRVEGNTDLPITGVMTSSSKYVVTAADVGFTLKVITSFTDNGGTVERLTSAESDTVVAAMPSECPTPDLGGRTEVWSATLTPANINTAQGTIGYDAQHDPQHGTLSDTSFDVAGDETVIEQIYVNEYTDRLILAFDSDQALPEQGHRTLRLHLCGKSVPLAGGGLAIHHILVWSSLRLDWTAGTTVHLALSAPAANEATPPTLVSAETSTDGERITLTFSEDVTVHPIVYVVGDLFNARPGDFLRSIMNLTIDGHRDLLFSADISGATITYHVVTPAIRRPQVVKLAYNNIFARSLEGTIGGLIIDRAGNALALFDEITVGNNSTLPGGATTRTGPTLSTDALTIDEGGTATYTVRLPSQPTGPVGVTQNTIPDVISLQPQTLTFTVDDWDTPQTVTLTARSDTHSFVVWAVAVHTYSDLLPHIGRSSSFLRVVVENQDTPLVVSGGSTEPILYAENGTTDLATYSVTGPTVTWTPYGEDKDAFAIGGTGVLSFVSPPDFENPSDADGDNVYTVGIVAADGSATGLAFATVVVTNVELPEFPSATTTRSVAENTAAGVDIGLPVTATTVGVAVTYTLGGTDAASFDIVEATGQLQTVAALDYETRSSYKVTVTATNSEGSVDIMVTIDVTNVIELQPLTGPATVDYEENRAVRVATYSASSEADRELVGWSLSGADAGSFRIDEPGGVLRFDLAVAPPNLFSPLPDYEAPTDTGNDGTYEVTLSASDGTDTVTLDVTVTVTNEDEAGVVTLSPVRPRVGTALNATLTDPDGSTSGVAWAWERSTGPTTWVAIGGAESSSYTPAVADAGHYLRATATYDDGHGAGKSARAVAPYTPLTHELSALSVTGPARGLYPAFDPEVLHYAMECAADQTITLTLSAAESSTRVAVNGLQRSSQNAVVELTGLDGYSDIPITLSGSEGGATTYVLHCFQEDFPDIATEKGSGATEELIGFSLHSTPPGLDTYGYLVIVDNNGVPRVHRRISARANHFRPQNSETYPFSYSVGDAQTRSVWILVDRDLNELERVATVLPLLNTDRHDFIILDNGDYLLLSYEPALRDFSSLTDGDGNPLPVNPDRPDGLYPVSDTAIQIRTPAGAPELTWYSWDHMAVQDCGRGEPFPEGDYVHGNSLWMADGVIVASLRLCGKVLGIDAATGDVVWRLGRSYRPPEEWGRDDLSGEGRGTGPAPMTILNDPYGEFCGQHSAQILDNGHLLLYDNGGPCVVDLATGLSRRETGVFSRAVEYAIDLDNGEAILQRHHSLHGDFNRFGGAAGLVQPMGNGDWLISWGWDLLDDDPNAALPPDESVTQVDPDDGTETFSINIQLDHRGEESIPVRAYPLSPVALAAEPIALAAEFPVSTYTSIFHLGATDSPQVVVSFSRPVVDFDETTPSLSVQGASVASVSAHVVAGEPAHAYLVSLTPDGDGAITFDLLADQACADGGICTADGTTLSEVSSAPLIIPTFVAEVSIEPGPSPVTEGADATFTLTRNGPLTAELTVNVTVEETGSMLSGALPASATFGVGADTTTLTLATEDDAPIEDPSTVTVTIEAGARYQAAPGAAAADAVVLDDLPRFLLKVGPAEVTEGGGGAVTVEVTNSVSLATAQTISLTLSGTATADDFTLLSTSGGTLSAPYALTIPANERVAAAYISTVNDALAEPAETLTITASHDGTEIGTETMTLRASPLRLELSSLTASGGGGRAMYPAFDPGTLHYAVGCDPAQTLTLRLSTTDATTRLAVNGIQQVNQNAVVELNQLDGDDDILITLSNDTGASTTYVVHCMNSDDPFISVEKGPGSSIELIAGSVNEGRGLGASGRLMVIDANGVPRVLRRIDNPRVTHFRPQDNREFPYSHALTLPEPFQSPWGARRDFEIAILDRDFNEVRRVTTTSAIPQTDQHDFLTKENGNFIFMAYAPFEHDLSEFVDHHGNPYGTQPAEDSLIEEVTPDGEQVFFWNSYNHMYLGDCMLNQFPANYGHLNSLQLVDDEDLVISLRNCSQVLRIDGTSGDVQWRLGSSKRSDAEWEALGLQPPLRIIGDPYVEFCAQHSAKLMPNGHLLLYDNGWHCPRDPATGLPRRPEEEFSRVVEYALDLERGTATFVRHHSLHGTFTLFNTYQGLVAPMVNDSWLISWGFSEPHFTNRPDTTATEYNPTTDQELLSLKMTRAPSMALHDSRTYPLGFDVLEQQADPLAAALPQSAHTSVFTFGQSDTPTLVVAFSEPVKDFAADTSAVSVIGATIASVAPHIVAGEPANAYLFTLTPDGDGPITLRLFANQSCSSGGICTADGAMLSEVPGTYTIEAPVRVSFEETSFIASEGASASVVVSLSAPSGPFGITIPIVVTGGTASADEYTAPEPVVFSSGEDRQTVSIALGDDALIEGNETIALAFGDLPTGVTPGTNSTTTVTITDADSAGFEFAVSDDEVGEGATVELTLTLDGDATFPTAQTIELTFSGGGATSGVDFTVTDSQGQTLTAPYALTLPAGSSSVVATISIVDDAAEEDDETIVVSASHEAVSLGFKFITILANDAPPPPTNSPPVFTEGRSAARSLAENTGPSITIGRPLAATDVDLGDTLFYSLGGTDAGSFDISLTSGQLRTKSGVVYDHEARSSYPVTVTVSDGEDTASIDVTIAVTDEDEPPDAPVVQVDSASPVSLNVTWLAPATSGRPAVRDYDLRYKLDSETGFVDGPQDVSGTSASIGELIPASSYQVQVRATNAEGDGPWSGSQPGETAVLPVVTLILSESSIPENRGMSTVTATVSPASPTRFSVEIWAAAFPPIPGQFETSLNTILSFAANETQSTGEVVITGLVAAVVNVSGTVSPDGVLVKPPARVRLQITESGTTTEPETTTTSTTNSGGGGGGSSGPSPSIIDFEWNVKRDIEQLDGGHDKPTGAWSDGTTLWLAENGDGADDAVYAYDLVTGERVEEREFELDESNRAPRGLWSNGKTAWVADSGRDRLFAYDLESGERDEEREVELDPRNRDPRGIWSEGTTVWVLDGGKDALFAYDLKSSELLAEYALHSANSDPRGLWSDGVSVWVSDHGAKRLFAYRLPAPESPAAGDVLPLDRVRDEEFANLSRASNNSPRGIWSDGDVMYVADESDGRVYTYNMPDALDARLASLTLSGVDFGEFLPGRTEYDGVAAEGVTETTVEAGAVQRRTDVAIHPPDADEEAEGHQVALEGTSEISVTVISADGSRELVYRVRLRDPEPTAASGSTSHCFRGDVAAGFNLVIYEGGSIEDLVVCALSRHIVALYMLDNGVYVPYIVGAPEFVNRSFHESYPDGVPPFTPFVAGSNGPPSAGPIVTGPAEDELATLRGSNCLGENTTGFSFVVYGGGSVEELETCAGSQGVTALYVLSDGEWVPLILGAPDFVNRSFFDLYPGGLPALTPLVAYSDSPLTASANSGDGAEN